MVQSVDKYQNKDHPHLCGVHEGKFATSNTECDTAGCSCGSGHDVLIGIGKFANVAALDTDEIGTGSFFSLTWFATEVKGRCRGG